MDAVLWNAVWFIGITRYTDCSRTVYRNNPIYHISLDEGSDENEIFIELKGPKQYSVGFEVKQVSSPRNKPFERRDSGAFRPGYTVLALESVPAGVYSIQPMTFLKDQEGPEASNDCQNPADRWRL
ncbi:Calpain-7 [Toxocara canis]|uniref:Calpain-7 n=1 Tax=Toxocara canis TaxID=6265 RepID=A0A0B2VBL6_TOXCA|nr:Calpain-7 [Toxocara canis]